VRTILQGDQPQPIPLGWIVLHDSDVVKKERGLVPITIRASAIDAMHPRGSYTTLDVHGHWIHVVEKIGEITKLVEEAEASLL
jgi:hypothetical protein